MAAPAFSNRAQNPYNHLLYSAMQEQGVEVAEFSKRQLLGQHFDVCHLHWPDQIFNDWNGLRAAARFIWLCLILGLARRRGTKVFWTIHNVIPHENRHRLSSRCGLRCLARLVDGWFSLSHSGHDIAEQALPGLANKPGFVVPHGHYLKAYPDNKSREESRNELGIRPDARVTCFFGQIRAYKNVPALMKAFAVSGDAQDVLLIAGHPRNQRIARELADLAGNDPRVLLRPHFVPSDETQLYFRAADLIVLPYHEVLNSGSALLALSFGCPVLVPVAGALQELAEWAGDDWVMTYEGELTPALLEAALKRVTSVHRPARPARISDLDWSNIATKTVAAYRAVLHAAADSLPIQQPLTGPT
jgi:glycosyltransferase involved in cell wall biosynthesis